MAWKFICPECGRGSMTRKAHAAHMRSHALLPTRECKHCGEDFVPEHDLQLYCKLGACVRERKAMAMRRARDYESGDAYFDSLPPVRRHTAEEVREWT